MLKIQANVKASRALCDFIKEIAPLEIGYLPLSGCLLTAMLLFVSINVFPQNTKCRRETVALYNVTIKGVEATGQKCFSSTSHFYKTAILKPLIGGRVRDITRGLGSYRTDYRYPEAIDLFNLSWQRARFPLLDSIDFDYYENVGFDQISETTQNSDEWKSLVKALGESKNVAQKKKVLFDSPFVAIRNELLLTKYNLRHDTFSIDQHKVTKTTASLKAKLDSIIINSGISASAEASAYISSLADETVIMKGVYYEAVFDPAYISKIDYYLDPKRKLVVGTDQFSQSLLKYKALDKAAVNSGLVALGISGTLNKKRIQTTSLAAELQGKFGLTKEQATRIAVNLNIAFKRDLNKTINVSYDNVFTLRYFTALVIDELSHLEDNTIPSILVNIK